MRFLTLLASLLLAGVALIGCGGAGAGSGGPEGVWSGGFTSTSDVNGSLDFDFHVSGSTLTGFSRLTVGGVVHTGQVVGTYTGDLNFSVDYSGGYGTVTYSLLISGGAMGGDYSRTGESGTVLLNFIASSTPVAAGTWNGTYAATTAPPASGTMSITFTQSGNDLDGSLSITPSGGSLTTATVNGEIFGNSIQLRGDFGAFGTLQWTGTLSGTPATAMSGQYTRTDTSGGHGFFSVTKQ